jgi:ATP-binding cassette subfamily B protein
MQIHELFEYTRLLLKKNRMRTTIVITLGFISSLFYSAETIVLAELIDELIGIVAGNVQKESSAAYVAIFNVVIIWILGIGITYLYERTKAKLTVIVREDITVDIAKKKMRLPYVILENVEKMELMQRLGVDPSKMILDYFVNEMSLLENVVRISGLIIIIFLKSPIVAIFVVIVIIPYYFMSIKNGRNDYEAYEEAEKHFRKAEYFKKVLSSKDYLEERTLFDFSEIMNKRWSDEYKKGTIISNDTNKIVFFRAGVLDISATLLIGIIASGLLYSVYIERVTIGLFIALLKGIINFVEVLSYKISNEMLLLEKGKLFYRDYMSFSDIEEENEESVNSEDIICKLAKDPRGLYSIEFIDVTFAYPGTTKKILEHMSFKLLARKQYAFVGENGAGKSTILKLLLGFYDNYSGDIIINGMNLREIKKHEIRRMLSVVFQDPTKYEMSLGEYFNVADLLSIQKVFTQLNVDFLQLDKEEDLNKSIGFLEDESMNFSGGQWQMLAIARSVIREASVYILDEPTAAIDPIKEAQIYAIFKEMIFGKSALLITHRLGAAKIADEIVVIGDGKVLEQGSHEELLYRKEKYYEMFQTQRKWYVE